MQFSLVARTWKWEKDDIELATVWVWKSYYKSSNFVSISCVLGFEMEHKFHKTCAWGLMLLCPQKIGFVQGSTSVVCCVVIYFLLLRVVRCLRIPIHKKMGILKFITLKHLQRCYSHCCLLCLITMKCITLQNNSFSARRSLALGRTLLFLSINTIKSFLFTIYYYTSCPI